MPLCEQHEQELEPTEWTLKRQGPVGGVGSGERVRYAYPGAGVGLLSLSQQDCYRLQRTEGKASPTEHPHLCCPSRPPRHPVLLDGTHGLASAAAQDGVALSGVWRPHSNPTCLKGSKK